MAKVLIPSENVEQMRFASWMDKEKIAFFAIPNGGKRNLHEAINFKRTGVKSGVPDLFVPVPSGIYHGLFIEMKRSKGSAISDNQLYWLGLLREKGYFSEVCYGFDEAKQTVLGYLSLAPR